MFLFAEYFDIFMIHRKKDSEKILKLKEILQKFVKLPDNRQLTFSLQDIGFEHIANRYTELEKSLKHSRYKFIYVGEDFGSDACDADEDDGEFRWQLEQHWALNEMIEKNDSSIVPVTDNPKTKVPMLLDIFKRLDVWKLLMKRSLNDVPDVHELGDEDVSRHSVNFILYMLNPDALPTPR